MPSFLPDNNLAMADSPSTSHRLASFLSRPFRTNALKRTKSFSKLDRKRSAIDSDGPSWSTTAESGGSGTRNSRSSRSHESLPNYSNQTRAIDLSRNGCTVTPFHSSLLGAPHCFRIDTPGGATKYYACRTAAERNRWLERYYCELCLDHALYCRTTAKLKLKDECFWGEQFEINHLPKLTTICINLYREADRKKKKDRNTLVGYVEIPVSLLTVRHPVEKWYAVAGVEKVNAKNERPSVRVKARYQTVTILPLRVYEDLLRYTQRHYLGLCSAVEHLTSVKAKEDIASCIVHILHKQRLAKDFLCDLVMSEVTGLDNYHLMFRGNSLATKAMECYMKLVGDRYLHDTLAEFIQTVLESDQDCEVDPSKLTNLNLLENHREALTKQVHLAWGKIVNSFYDFPLELRYIFNELRNRLDQCGRSDLADFLISSNIFLRFLCPSILSPSLFNLIQGYLLGILVVCTQRFADSAWRWYRPGMPTVPLRPPSSPFMPTTPPRNSIVFDREGFQLSGQNSPTPCTFSCCFSIAEYPNEKTVRNLTLIAKTIQTLANFTKFGVKEQYMEFMNSFVEGESDHMRQYLIRISNVASKDYLNKCMEWDGCVDLGKQLSLLHAYLTESWPAIRVHRKQRPDRAESTRSTSLLEFPPDLKQILDRISERIQSPADGDVNLNTTLESTSPTSPISDYENNNVDQVQFFEFGCTRFSPPRYKLSLGDKAYVSADKDTETLSDANRSPKQPMSNLNSTDNYVYYSAVDENLGLRRTGVFVQQNRQRRIHGSLSNSEHNHTSGSLSPNELSAAVAVTGEDIGELNFVDDINAVVSDVSNCSVLRGSHGSLINGHPVSSGYHSLSYSTSDSGGSPTDHSSNRTRKSFKYALADTWTKSCALAISNPLYCLRTVPVPLIKGKGAPCHSMPDIQRELETSTTAPFFGVAPADGSGYSNDSNFDERNYGVADNGERLSLAKQDSGFIPRGAAVLINERKDGGGGSHSNNTGQSATIDWRTQLPSTNAPASGKSPAPRTNPHYACKSGRSPTLPSNGISSRPVMRRTKTDFGIDSELSMFLQELDETSRKLEETQVKLKEVEDSEKSSVSRSSKSSWSEKVKPLARRLKAVEFELREELSASSKKQQIIDAQQKRIESLQSANDNLLAALNALKSRAASSDENSLCDEESTSLHRLASELSSTANAGSLPSSLERLVVGEFDGNRPTIDSKRDSILCNISRTSSSEIVHLVPVGGNLDEIGNENDKIVLDFSGLKTTEC